jgi:hypothetical protein
MLRQGARDVVDLTVGGRAELRLAGIGADAAAI